MKYWVPIRHKEEEASSLEGKHGLINPLLSFPNQNRTSSFSKRGKPPSARVLRSLIALLPKSFREYKGWVWITRATVPSSSFLPTAGGCWLLYIPCTQSKLLELEHTHPFYSLYWFNLVFSHSSLNSGKWMWAIYFSSMALETEPR